MSVLVGIPRHIAALAVSALSAALEHTWKWAVVLNAPLVRSIPVQMPSMRLLASRAQQGDSVSKDVLASSEVVFVLLAVFL